MTKPTPIRDSPILRAIDYAITLAQAQEAAGSRSGVSGVRGAPEAPGIDVPPLSPLGASAGESASEALVSQLSEVQTSISSQIVTVRKWLEAHPDLRDLLDKGMRQEFQEMEKRINRRNLFSNVVFTFLGAVLGLLLPLLLAALPYLLRH